MAKTATKVRIRKSCKHPMRFGNRCSNCPKNPKNRKG